MTTTPSPPPSRSTRFIPSQFSLRSLLIIITSASLFFGWALQRPRGLVTEREVESIKREMTKIQVSWKCGYPIGDTKNAIWAYNIDDRPNHVLFITFDAQGDRVFSVFIQETPIWEVSTEPIAFPDLPALQHE